MGTRSILDSKKSTHPTLGSIPFFAGILKYSSLAIILLFSWFGIRVNQATCIEDLIVLRVICLVMWVRHLVRGFIVVFHLETIVSCCVSSPFDSCCGEPPARNNQNVRYNRNIGAQKRFYLSRPTSRGNLLWARSIQNNSLILPLASSHTYILILI